MKKTIKTTLLLICSLLILWAASCTDKKPAGDDASKAEQTPVEMGKEIYMQKCRSCHGTDGRGTIGPDLTDNEWKYGSSDNQLFESISEGRPGGMPGWKNKLGEEKIRNVILYVRHIGEN